VYNIVTGGKWIFKIDISLRLSLFENVFIKIFQNIHWYTLYFSLKNHTRFNTEFIHKTIAYNTNDLYIL
jgi:hypothetical protein